MRTVPLTHVLTDDGDYLGSSFFSQLFPGLEDWDQKGVGTRGL